MEYYLHLFLFFSFFYLRILSMPRSNKKNKKKNYFAKPVLVGFETGTSGLTSMPAPLMPELNSHWITKQRISNNTLIHYGKQGPSFCLNFEAWSGRTSDFILGPGAINPHLSNSSKIHMYYYILVKIYESSKLGTILHESKNMIMLDSTQ